MNKPKRKQDFYYGLFVDRKLPPSLASVGYSLGSLEVKPFEFAQTEPPYQGTSVALYCPDYLEYSYETERGLTCKKIFREKGFAVDLNGFSNGEAYLRGHFKPNFRTALRRRIHGLETCLDITYRMYFGAMEKDDYTFLMNSLKTMLTRRFNQRNDENRALANWAYFESKSLELIRSKDASLFVIYDGDKPIQITLNYHLGPVFFQAIPSYDIDYAKFGLGNIAIYKIMEWCIGQKFTLLDMGFGAFEYKLKWCNLVYDFNHLVFYRRNSLISQLFLLKTEYKTRLLNFLLKKRVNVYYHQLKDRIMGGKESDLREPLTSPMVPNDFNPNGMRELKPATDTHHKFLLKPLYDFAYTKNEPVSGIRVFEVTEGSEYLLLGSKEGQRLEFPPT